MSIGVYKIVHLASGRYYIGHSIAMRKRWYVHESKLSRGVHHCAHLQHAWTLYGSDSFEFRIVVRCETQADAANIEQSILDAEFSTGRLFNSLSRNAPLEALNEARRRAHSPASQSKRIATTRANGTWCAAQRMPVRAHRIADGHIETFDSLSGACRALSLSKGNVASVCNGERLSAGGYTFWYAPEAVA